MGLKNFTITFILGFMIASWVWIIQIEKIRKRPTGLTAPQQPEPIPPMPKIKRQWNQSFIRRILL